MNRVDTWKLSRSYRNNAGVDVSKTPTQQQLIAAYIGNLLPDGVDIVHVSTSSHERRRMAGYSLLVIDIELL
jgi:hypothetical protein